MSTFKTFKHTYDNIKFMSEGEVKMYKELEYSGLDFEYQPGKIEIRKGFTSLSGKKYQALNWEPDFKVKWYQWDKRKACGHCSYCDTIDCYEPKIKKVWQHIYIEVKGANDKVWTYFKGGSKNIKDRGEYFRLKHKVIDEAITEKGNLFLVVRDSELKTPCWSGMFWEKDLEQLRKYKTQKRKELCEMTPRIVTRLRMFRIGNKSEQIAMEL